MPEAIFVFFALGSSTWTYVHLVYFGSLFIVYSSFYFLFYSCLFHCTFEANSCLFLVLSFFHLTLSVELSLMTQNFCVFRQSWLFQFHFRQRSSHLGFFFFWFFVIFLFILLVTPSRVFGFLLCSFLFLVSILLLYLRFRRPHPLFRA